MLFNTGTLIAEDNLPILLLGNGNCLYDNKLWSILESRMSPQRNWIKLSRLSKNVIVDMEKLPSSYGYMKFKPIFGPLTKELYFKCC